MWIYDDFVAPSRHNTPSAINNAGRQQRLYAFGTHERFPEQSSKALLGHDYGLPWPSVAL